MNEGSWVVALLGLIGGSAFTGMVTAIVKTVSDHKSGVRTTDTTLRIRELDADERFVETLMKRLDKAEAMTDKLNGKVQGLQDQLTVERIYTNRLAETLADHGILPPPRPSHIGG